VCQEAFSGQELSLAGCFMASGQIAMVKKVKIRWKDPLL
jgi:hypothetical protein